MAINVRNTLIRTGFDSDHHYSDLQDNELLTKVQFPSGVHEVIADPLSNTTATREFYQLSILSETSNNAGTDPSVNLVINDSNSVINNITTVSVPTNSIDSEIAALIVTDLKADDRFDNIIQDVNTINFNTVSRGVDGNSDLITLTNGSRTAVDTGNTNVKWRIDVLQSASNPDAHSELVLDAGIWTGI